VEAQQPAAEAGEDNKEHPELNNLRDALATSLASPGGVELVENPIHNGGPHPEMVEGDKANFPSEGPNHRTKHMSFARTVSDEVNWGEDDEVDPKWNIQRTDTDPFKGMAKSDRTNSFPEVPPTHAAPTFHPDESLPHSQAEDIMNQAEHESKDLFGDEGDDVDADELLEHRKSDTHPDDSVEPAGRLAQIRPRWRLLGLE